MRVAKERALVGPAQTRGDVGRGLSPRDLVGRNDDGEAFAPAGRALRSPRVEPGPSVTAR